MSNTLHCAIALIRREWLQSIRYPGWYIPVITAPALFVFPYLLTGLMFSGSNDPTSLQVGVNTGMGDPISFIIIGSSLWVWFHGLLWDVGNTLRNEQLSGTLESLLICPVGRAVLIASPGLVHIGLNLVQTTLMICEARLFFQFSLFNNFGLTLLILSLTSLSFYGVGLVYSALIFRFKEAASLSNIVGAVVMSLSGATFALSLLPPGIRAISWCIPLTWSIELLRKVLIRGAGLKDGLLELSVLAGFGVVGIAVGLTLIWLTERSGRRKGTVGMF